MENTLGIEIGNWLYDKNRIAKQVTEVYDDSVTMGGELHHVSTVWPVPLTGDILRNSGFMLRYSDECCEEYVTRLPNQIGVRFSNYMGRYVTIRYENELTHHKIDVRKDDFAVHELQNLFTLFGIRKEIRV